MKAIIVGLLPIMWSHGGGRRRNETDRRADDRRVGVHVLGRWRYTETMPVVPGLGVGVIPIAQMLLLPPLVFRIVAVFGARKGG